MLQLPVDLVILILSYTPLPVLGTLASVSRDWNAFLQAHESVLFHNAAILHAFVPSASIVYSELAAVISRRAMSGVSDWKTFCLTQLRIEQSWRGADASGLSVYRYASPLVHRIKVDEQRGFAVVTTENGGVIVVDLDEDVLLWSLPPSYVRAYAHCEYEDGFLIFDRGVVNTNNPDTDGGKEVWRLLEDFEAESHPPPEFHSPPDRYQMLASDCATQAHWSQSRRGHFRPWALLKSPAPTRAFRFVYPTLIAAAECYLCFLWDVPSGRLVQTIAADRDPVHDLEGDVNYVEVNAEHAFVCSSQGIKVFSRATGRKVLILASNRYHYAKGQYSFERSVEQDGPSFGHADSMLRPQPMKYTLVSEPTAEDHHLFDAFIAVHVSACGSHLVGLLMTSRLVVIPHFQRLFNNQAQLTDIALDIQVGSPISVGRYLAFENNRIGIATGTGIFVVSLAPDLDQPTPTLRLQAVHRIPWFNHSVALAGISCLQLSPTGLFVNWDPHYPPVDVDTTRRRFRAQNAVPDESGETDFRESLSEEGVHFELDEDNAAVQLFEPAERPSSSCLFSVDFVEHAGSSLTRITSPVGSSSTSVVTV
ncbi:F-box domain-containing protein [Mycena chlorophos]|uniref:F-box domain-containing protein n=1 Tax=Mycena chlorophos TaxID=658473 RepID=A0A8H6SPF1_MYCCL|nr:F-box domain-containing protein [Mycena chlorophos]